MYKKSQLELVFEKLKIDINGCWIYLGKPGRGKKNTYGYVRKLLPNGERKTITANKYIYEFYYGPIPDNMLLCHTCDVPACVNPDHQFVGTPKDNIQDCINKGRRGIKPKKYRKREPDMKRILSYKNENHDLFT